MGEGSGVRVYAAERGATESFVITGFVPVIPLRKARRSSNRDGRVKPGHDKRKRIASSCPRAPPPCPSPIRERGGAASGITGGGRKVPHTEARFAARVHRR